MTIGMEVQGQLIRRIYEVEVLFRKGHTETNMDSASLESLAYETCDGAASGIVTIKSEEILTPAAMAAALVNQGSDAGFLLTQEEELTSCQDCDKPVFYDDEQNRYRHTSAEDRIQGCFLIWPENSDGTLAEGQWIATNPAS